MGRDPRYVPPHSLQHVVDVTFQNRFFLAPSPEVYEVLAGVLGRAQRAHRMKICAVVVLSSHIHLLVRPEDARHLASFMCFFKTNVSKEIGRLRGWKGSIFHGRYRSTTVSSEEAAQVRILRYLLSHGPKEGLVDSVGEWPGIHCAEPLANGTELSGRWYDRTAEHRARENGGSTDEVESEERVRFSPLPCWEHLPESTWRRAVAEMVEEIDRQAAADRETSGRRSLGVAKVLSVDPCEAPEEIVRSPKPRFHAHDKEVLRSLLEIWREVIQAFREASAELRSGNRLARFPEGTFPPALSFVSFEGAMHFAARGRPV